MGRAFRDLVNRLLAGATDIRPGEGQAVLASATVFFLVLWVIMLLRPVRDAIGLWGGREAVRYLFLGTVLMTFAVVPAFGWLAARLPRRRLLAITLRASAVALCVFYACVQTFRAGWIGAVYYVFHSTINLLLVFLFWALMADLFSLAESKRLFPPIAVGGTLGALSGAAAARVLAEAMGALSLFLVAAIVLEIAVWAMRWAIWTRRQTIPATPSGHALGGGAWEGLRACVRSPYLAGIAGYAVLTAVASTFLYFMQLRLVEDASASTDTRTALFAALDIWTQGATLVAQVFVAGRVMRWLGVGAALAALPVCALTGLGVLALWPGLQVYAAVNAGFRAVQRGVTRPARETLFTVLTREEKYKAKSFIDVFVFRTGDALGARLDRWLELWRPALGWLGMLGAGWALAWIGLAVALARAQTRRSGVHAGKQS